MRSHIRSRSAKPVCPVKQKQDGGRYLDIFGMDVAMDADGLARNNDE